jgi:hypothetical protein
MSAYLASASRITEVFKLTIFIEKEKRDIGFKKIAPTLKPPDRHSAIVAKNQEFCVSRYLFEEPDML